MKFNETQVRSVSKVISWRILITVSHIINAFVVTGSLILGIKIASLALIINSVLYWIHERSWNLLQWNRKEQEKIKFNEGNPRSFSKVISWRILITISNFVIPFVMTGSWGQAVLFAGIATIINMILYWGHERAWNLIKFGKSVTI
jgi:uncharacterized membrane protein